MSDSQIKLKELLLKEIRSLIVSIESAIGRSDQSATLKNLHSIKGLFQSDARNELVEMCHSVEDFYKNSPEKTYDIAPFIELKNSIKEQYKELELSASEKPDTETQLYPLKFITDSNLKTVEGIEKHSEKSATLIQKIEGEPLKELSLDSKNVISLISTIRQLIRNSFAHSELNEGLKLMITFKKIDSSLQINYRDNGKAENIKNILAEHSVKEASELKKILFSENFSSSSKPDFISGRGLGLALVDSLVSTLNGSVELSLDTGHLEFIIKIPLK